MKFLGLPTLFHKVKGVAKTASTVTHLAIAAPSVVKQIEAAAPAIAQIEEQVKTMNWLQIILSVGQLLPTLLSGITSVEQVIGRAHGATKKAIVMTPLAGAPPEVQAAASSFIDRTVATLTAAGLLPNTGAPAAPAEPAAPAAPAEPAAPAAGA